MIYYNTDGKIKRGDYFECDETSEIFHILKKKQ